MTKQPASAKELRAFGGGNGVGFLRWLAVTYKINPGGAQFPVSLDNDFILVFIPSKEILNAPTQVSCGSLLINLRYKSVEDCWRERGATEEQIVKMLAGEDPEDDEDDEVHHE